MSFRKAASFQTLTLKKTFLLWQDTLERIMTQFKIGLMSSAGLLSFLKTLSADTRQKSQAAFFGDKIVLIKEGRIIQEGGIMELIKTPTDPFVTKFINAQRNHLEELRGF